MALSTSVVWQFPGPAGFAESVYWDVADGKSVAVVRPRNSPSGLVDAVERRCAEESLRRIVLVDCESKSLCPARLVAESVGIDTTTVGLFGAQELASCFPKMEHRVFWVMPTSSLATEWFALVEELQPYMALSDPFLRPCLCVESVGVDGFAVPGSDSGLSVRRWGKCVRRLDVMLMLDLVSDASADADVWQQMRRAVVAELAGADFELAESLLHLEDEALLAPTQVLCEYGGGLGWSAETLATQENGSLEFVDGAPREHSSLVSLKGDEVQIRRRVWKGQVGVLFPYLEGQRLRIVDQLRHVLERSLPTETKYGRKEAPEDLELGEIRHVLWQANVPSRIRTRVGRLTAMRHDLAHLRPVGPEQWVGES